MLKKFFNYIILTLLLTACFGPVDNRKNSLYLISSDMPPVQCKTFLNNASLMIAPTYAIDPYHTKHIFYSDSTYKLDNYTYSDWAALPNEMITKEIGQAILNACIYSSITGAQAVVGTTYRLETLMTKLQQNFPEGLQSNSSTAVLQVYASLVDNKTNKIIKTMLFNEQMAAKPDAKGMVDTTNQLVTKLTNDITNWLKA